MIKGFMCAVRIVIASFAVSVVLRILFGLYCVSGTVGMIVTVLCAALTVHFIIPRDSDRFFAAALAHMSFVTVFFVLADRFALFSSLAEECAAFVENLSGRSTSHGLLVSIVCVTSVYFLSFIAASLVTSALHAARLRSHDEEPESDEESEIAYK